MLHTCANFSGLPVANQPRVQPRVSASLHNLEHFFTLSHLLPLHDSHLNKGLLIAKIQANLTRNKANKMVDKIQPYSFSFCCHLCPSDLGLSCWLLGLCSCNRLEFLLLGLIWEEHKEEVEEHKEHQEIFFN